MAGTTGAGLARFASDFLVEVSDAADGFHDRGVDGSQQSLDYSTDTSVRQRAKQARGSSGGEGKVEVATVWPQG